LGLSRFTAPALAALAANDSLAHLTTLTFWANHMTDETFAPFAGSKRLATVRTLSLTQNQLTGASLRVLIDALHTAGLRSLDLFANPIGDGGIRTLGLAKFRLRVLNLTAVGMTDDSAPDLANWPGLRSLRLLVLGANQLTVVAAKELAESPHFTDGVM